MDDVTSWEGPKPYWTEPTSEPEPEVEPYIIQFNFHNLENTAFFQDNMAVFDEAKYALEDIIQENAS